MANVLVIGAGLNGLSSAMLLALDGHEVTVVERDPGAPEPDPGAAWEQWARPGVNQFRLPHLVLCRWNQLMRRELPQVVDRLREQGALQWNIADAMPDRLTGGRRDGDERFDEVTARRPVLEGALASCANETYGLTVRRGVGVAGLRTLGDGVDGGAPRVVGVRTEAGEDIDADLVVDVSGRRSPVRRWLADIGTRPPLEEIDESGNIYYTRHFRSADGSIPETQTFLLQEHESLSLITLPADNGTWSVVLTAAATDAALRPLRDPEVWMRTVARYPMVEPWLEGEPITGVDLIAKLEDRWHGLVVDGDPVVTGFVGLGDAWACTSPALGRGASIGLTHACLLRDLLREVDVHDHEHLARTWSERTEATVGELFRMTRTFDNHRLAEMQADAAGARYEPEDPGWAMTKAMAAAALADPDIVRARLEIINLLATPPEVFARPGIAERVVALGSGAPRYSHPGPDRAELLALVGGRVRSGSRHPTPVSG